MAKILYISPEHVSGNLTLFQKGHRARGHECRYVTFFPSSSNFPEDICLNLPLMPDSHFIRTIRKIAYRDSTVKFGKQDLAGYPPLWRPETAAEAMFFVLRDKLLSAKIERVIRHYGFNHYNLIHLDQGLDFYRNARFVKRMKSNEAYVTCFYHGNDMRNRGVIPEVDAISDLNLTSELDLLSKHPKIKYLHLPFDVEAYSPKNHENDPLVIGHACRGPDNRHHKGSDQIVSIVKSLEIDFPVKLDFVEGVPNAECLRRKSGWDIAVDQIADQGGWGYGMNSLETLSMGIPTCTRMNAECEGFFSDHPFVNVDENNLRAKLIELIQSREYRQKKAEEGCHWVMKRHSLDSVMNELYAHYSAAGITLESP
ncbi:MAG: hypothetical protein NTW14_14225 [bacterium]|nr:hypothetical protein [bacterium]